jgi:hypothetical protein
MNRIIYRHVTSALLGETETFREVLVNGSTLVEREKKFDPVKSTDDRKRYKTHERVVDPSFAGYDLVQLIVSKGLADRNDLGTTSIFELEGRDNERVEVLMPELRAVFTEHPRHHWSPAMTSVIAGLAGRINWDSDKEAA